jgi:hypothetical protein
LVISVRDPDHHVSSLAKKILVANSILIGSLTMVVAVQFDCKLELRKDEIYPAVLGLAPLGFGSRMA